MVEFIKMECRKKPEEKNQNRGEHKLLKIEAFFIFFMFINRFLDRIILLVKALIGKINSIAL